MTRVAVSTLLRHAPEVVFAVLADPRNDPRWCAAVASCVYLDGAPPGEVGARYEFEEGFKADKLMTGQVEITVREPPWRMVSVATTPRRRYEITYRLEPHPEGTHLTQVAQARFAGAAGHVTWLFKPMIAWQYRRQFRDLGRLLALDVD